MKKSHFLYLTLVVAIATCLVVFAMTICADDDSFDMFSYTSSFLHYDELFAHILSQKGIFHEYCNDAISSQPIISYLARHEKSPPAAIFS